MNYLISKTARDMFTVQNTDNELYLQPIKNFEVELTEKRTMFYFANITAATNAIREWVISAHRDEDEKNP